MFKICCQNYGIIRTNVLFIAIFLLTSTAIHANDCFAQINDDTSIRCYKDIAKTMVHGTALGLAEIIKDVKSEKKRIVLIRTFINPIRFFSDNSGYFYVYSFNGVNIAHAAQKELQGKNFSDHKDSKGKNIFRESSALARNGGGFFDFYWVKPGSKDEQKKLGYVERIHGTDYFIGTGVYLP